MTIIFIAIGGAVGAILRYLATIMLKRFYVEKRIPIIIASINWLGSFGLGVWTNYSYNNSAVSIGVAIGIFGAFTTFSTFSQEAFDLLEKKMRKEALIYILLTTFVSIGLFLCGYALNL